MNGDRPNSIPCELCGTNTVRGIVHEIKAQPGNYICEECCRSLQDDDGHYFDGYVMKVVPLAERTDL